MGVVGTEPGCIRGMFAVGGGGIPVLPPAAGSGSDALIRGSLFLLATGPSTPEAVPC